MRLIPYEPFRSLDHFRREFDPFFQSIRSAFDQFTPFHVDIYETDTEVVAECDIPGLEKKEDVHIDVDQDTLTIAGSIHRNREIKDDQFHRQERFSGRFQRTIPLPVRVKSEGVEATYRNGVLEIRMPKMQGETRRRIDVQFH
jgi:HSP20 family protein